MRLTPSAFCLFLAAASLLPASAPAQSQLYRWVDRAGVTHYGDRPPDTEQASEGIGPVRQQPLAVEPRSMASLHVLAVDGGHEVWAENHLAGPIEVMVSGGSRQFNATPPLPARATVATAGRGLVTRLHATDAAMPLRMIAVPGSPGGRVRDVEYRFPLRMATPRVAQGHGGSFSHADNENRHAVDFPAPVGTPVLAARDGVVMHLERDFHRGGTDPDRDLHRANFIRILHDDGSMALYAHLEEGGVLVRQGQHVRAGQTIGRSGNTGFSSGPHLHFVVQANRGMRVESVPFRMFGPQGILRFSLTR
ncbi:MAG: M23 family metallopeptidase [Pseudoxanthomonas suwonensis]|nr:M23 family metallopeptidase [Pseudoxanthomonas suwonensis]